MSPWKLVLVGFLRHIFGVVGTWLVAKGVLPAEGLDGWMSSAVAEATGYVLIFVAFAWSAFDKKKVIGWLRQALRMTSSEEYAAPQISKLVEK
jgi:uncharacterized membrane protein